jgi:hypothetical protein
MADDNGIVLEGDMSGGRILPFFLAVQMAAQEDDQG